MADTSDRIIILSALILVTIIVWTSMLPPIVSVSDIQIELETDKALYLVDEEFKVKASFYNEKSYAVRINTNIDYNLIGYTLGREGIPVSLGHGFPKNYNKIPPNSSIRIYTGTLQPRYSGEFFISCMGVNKTVLILDSVSAGETANAMMNKPTFNNTDDATLFITNVGLNRISFGTPYEIRIKDNGFWVDVYPSPYPSAFPSVKLILEPREIFRQHIKIDTLKTGQYRIRKEVFDDVNQELISLIVEFEIQEFLEKEYAWITATILTVEPSPTLEIVELSSEDKDIPHSLFKAIDKALEEEFIQEEVTPDARARRKLRISINEAESIIRYFVGYIEKDRQNYEFYVSHGNASYSILIQFYQSLVTS